MTDRENFLQQARTYIGQTGYGVCIEKLHIGFVCDWCAFSVSSIMYDCKFIGKYIKEIEGGAGTIPRYSDGKYGTWFKKGTKAPQAGDLFFLRYADYPSQDKYFCDHVGIVEAVNGNTITTLEGNVDGYGSNWAATSTFKRKTRYLSDYSMYAFYRPNWQDESTGSTGTSTNVSADTSKNSDNIDVIYQVHTVDGSWLPNVKNLEDFAGLENKPIDGIYINTSKGHICYRVHLTDGYWLPWVRDRQDYAGIFGKEIDAVQMEFYGLTNTLTHVAEYRVSKTDTSKYLDWVKNYNNVNDDGYAGILGKPIDKIQIKISKK